MSTAFAAYVAGSLRTQGFSCLDIGCSGGIDPAWRIFGDHLRVLAFDASVDECDRLTREEVNPRIEYIGGFVGLHAEHPLSIASAQSGMHLRSPFPRTSAAHVLHLQTERLAKAPLEEKLRNNAWMLTTLGDPSAPIDVPKIMEDRGWTDLDLLKIDIDGPDFLVLNSFDRQFDSLGLLAARLEVNLYGGTGPAEHVFHNTDRFMRDRGFELFGLDVRTYSMAALPSRFSIKAPAQTVSGRPVQAEAYYARDPAGSDWKTLGGEMHQEKLAKLAAIFSFWRQPDAAAELLVEFRSKLETLIDVDCGLELLAGQAQSEASGALSYKDYIDAFERDAPSFYPPRPTPPPPPTLRRKMRAALGAFREPHKFCLDAT